MTAISSKPIPVIGLDFGNFYSQPGVIVGADPLTKRGGVFYDLTDISANIVNGIPSAFFYSSDTGPLYCYQAELAVPVKNCMRYLKRRLRDGDIEIDGRTFSWDEIITKTVENIMRIANRQMAERLGGETTNLIMLSYPASFDGAERSHLVDLVERATLEDGRSIKVIGTIAEPAAAALDYLASCGEARERVALAYDLGAGTFDASLVHAYPEGRTNSEGEVKYYDIHSTVGLSDVGGAEFDSIVEQLLFEKAGEHRKNPMVAEIIRSQAESIKRDLTAAEKVFPNIMLPTGLIGPITREEFNEKARPKVMETIRLVLDILADDTLPDPDVIVLTGGASRMPIVESLLRETLPEKFRDLIVSHNPSKAIASGVARFGTRETDQAPQPAAGKMCMNTGVQQRTIHDIGIRYYRSNLDKVGSITTFVPAGSPIPYESEEIRSSTLRPGRYSLFEIYEANTQTPDSSSPTSDYDRVISFNYDNGRFVCSGYPHISRITIDERNMLHLTVSEPKQKEKDPQTFDCDIHALIS